MTLCSREIPHFEGYKTHRVQNDEDFVLSSNELTRNTPVKPISYASIVEKDVRVTRAMKLKKTEESIEATQEVSRLIDFATMSQDSDFDSDK